MLSLQVQLNLPPLMSIPSQTPADLRDSLEGLTTSVEQTMASVHSLNVYVLNSRAFEKHRPEFPALRHSLKHHWTGITEVLQQLYNVVDQLVFICNSIGNEPDHECIAFIKELDEPSIAAGISLRAAILQNEDILTKFEASSSKFVLQRPCSVNIVHQGSVVPSVGPGLSPATHQFVRDSLAAANPAGVPSAIAALSSLKDTQLKLTAILQFWSTLRSNFQAILSDTAQYRQVLEEYFKASLVSWEANRQDLRNAIPHLLRSVDAISVAALPTARRSSSNPFPFASSALPLEYTQPGVHSPRVSDFIIRNLRRLLRL